MSSLKKLYEQINKKMKSDCSLIYCREILKSYCSNDWRSYIKFCPDKYTRIILSEYSNDDFELVLICWNKDQMSPIHDHPTNGCLLKVLQGSLTEDVYVKHDEGQYLYVTSRINDVDSVSYMEADDVIHRIVNSNKKTEELLRSVSLHIYSPPKFKLKTFNEDVINS